MAAKTQPRKSKGTPVGGQFAKKENPECETTLTAEEQSIMHIMRNSTEWHDMRGDLHRVDGPAFMSSYVDKWYRHGRLHRAGGPAVIYYDGRREWWEDNKRIR
ncbi:MAG: hypothetical protein ACYDEP_02720 [Acidimicrobiales bacterium]